MAIFKMGEKEYKPLYIVTVNGRTTIENSWASVKLLWHGVSGASQERIDNKLDRKRYLNTVKKFGTATQYKYFKSLVEKEEAGEGSILLKEIQTTFSKSLF